MRITAGRFKGRELKTMRGKPGQGYRPATGRVREAVFSMLEARGVRWPGARVLDLFAGSGSLGLEALSRGADFALFIEKNRTAARIIQDNVRMLGLEGAQATVLARDLFAVLKQGPLPGADGFDLVCIDPPYGKDMLLPALELLLDRDWCAEGAVVLAELEAGLEIDPENLHPKLDLLKDKLYGQTRIVLWTLT